MSSEASKQIKDLWRDNSGTKISFAHVRDCRHAMGVTRAKLIVNNQGSGAVYTAVARHVRSSLTTRRKLTIVVVTKRRRPSSVYLPYGEKDNFTKPATNMKHQFLLYCASNLKVVVELLSPFVESGR